MPDPDVRANVNTSGDKKNVSIGPGEATGAETIAAAGFIVPIRQRTNDRLFPQSAATSTSATLGNGSLRVSPFVLPNDLSISHIGVDVTLAGEAGSTFRVGIYEDSTAFAGYPGALLAEASAVVDGTSATVQEVACAVSLDGNRLYWIGGAVQNAPTTQPTLRTISNAGAPAGLVVGSAPAANASMLGYQHTGATGALPATFQTTVLTAGSAARLHLRLA